MAMSVRTADTVTALQFDTGIENVTVTTLHLEKRKGVTSTIHASDEVKETLFILLSILNANTNEDEITVFDL